VIGILLISIFAVELRILPTGGMFGNLPPPETLLGYIPLVSRHMVLPVMAIFISLFFQLVYSWRTFFIVYAAEDYVELGVAKGLPTKVLEKKYIFRPAISYIITNFAVTLIGFWQMTMALEVIFDWPGIGWLYVKDALPNFWGLSMYPGELLAAVGVVVIFAYLLGFVVFLLDFIYVLVDPRITVADTAPAMQLKSTRSRPRIRFSWRPRRRMMVGKPIEDATRIKDSASKKIRTYLAQGLEFMSRLRKRSKAALVEIWRYPSAIAGLIIISVLVIGSVYAIVALPYQQIGSAWSKETLTGAPRIPKLAGPAWINIFRANDYLSVMTLDSQRGSDHVDKTVTDLQNEMQSITLNYTFDYSYADFPQEMYLYLRPTYLEKQPFVSLVWITPDGRQFELKGASFGAGGSYDFAENIPYKRIVRDNQNWQEWFNLGGIYPTPPHYVLFADPESDQAELVKGTYQLVVNGLFFEQESDLDAEFLLLGKVYGLAGTDYLRRDLIVPLLWGMPFALLFGLFGATLTTLVSMIVAATGVWFGGRVDNLVQRITEVNMVLPILAISVLAYAYLGINIWVILAVIVLLNVFGSPTKTYRAAFLQFRQAPYVEAAHAYGASDWRIISRYLVPRIIPVLVPQLITLIPSFIFLEATLGIFNIKSNYPTWGTVIYQGLTNGALYGSRYWVLEPLVLLLLTGISFSMLGAALDRILNPRLVE
jgi:peptide/nickel transport system permease protein